MFSLYAKLMGYEVRKPYERVKDLKPGYTFEAISSIPYKLIRFEKIEETEMAVVKSLCSSKYLLMNITTPVSNVKENTNDNDN